MQTSRTMNVIDFFEYLAARPATRELALELADAWAERQHSIVPSPAAAA